MRPIPQKPVPMDTKSTARRSEGAQPSGTLHGSEKSHGRPEEPAGVISGGVPAPRPRNPADQQPPLLNLVGFGLHLPRQRKRPKGTVERVGSRPENWRGLYYVYVVKDGIEKRVQRRPVLGPTASLSKRSAEDKLAQI